MVLHDKDIREPLFEYLEECYGRIRILEEIVMGGSRSDVIMVTSDKLYGIEIKSDADSYARLATQVRDYDRYFDMNIAVVGGSHGHHIREHLPEHWGVITVEYIDGEFDFYTLKEPGQNPGVTYERQLEFLWRVELAAIQEHFSMPKYKEKSKEFVKNKIVERLATGKIDETELKAECCGLLFERDYTLIEELNREYRKGEIQKKLDMENNPEKQIELMMKSTESRIQLKKKGRVHRKRRWR